MPLSIIPVLVLARICTLHLEVEPSIFWMSDSSKCSIDACGRKYVDAHIQYAELILDVNHTNRSASISRLRKPDDTCTP